METTYKTDRNSLLQRLGVLVGTWKMKGHDSKKNVELEGQLSYEWAYGGTFLVQHINVGDRKAMQFISYDEDSKSLRSQYLDKEGNVTEFEYEVDSDSLVVWMDKKNSETSFRANFSKDHNALSGVWNMPEGNYETVMTRVA